MAAKAFPIRSLITGSVNPPFKVTVYMVLVAKLLLGVNVITDPLLKDTVPETSTFPGPVIVTVDLVTDAGLSASVNVAAG